MLHDVTTTSWNCMLPPPPPPLRPHADGVSQGGECVEPARVETIKLRMESSMGGGLRPSAWSRPSPPSTPAHTDTFVYPDGWEDERLMCVRLADAPNPLIDPEGFAAHMHFWSTAIRSFAEQQKTLHFDIAHLEKRFTRHIGTTMFRPESLSEVIRYNIEKGHIQSSYEFLQSRSIVWNLLNYVASGIYQHVLSQPPQVPQGPYFFTDVVEDLADKVCKKVMASAVGEVDLILSYQQIRHTVSKLQGLEHVIQNNAVAIPVGQEVKDLDIDTKIVLQQIVNQKHAITFACSSHSIFVKFSNTKERSVSSVTESDQNVANLKYTIEYLEGHIGILDEKKKGKMFEVQQAIRAKSKRLAKWHLVRAKGLEREADTRSKQLHNLENLLMRISSSHSNREVFGAMKLAAASVNQIQRECGLDAESASDFMADLETTLDDASELDKALSQDVMGDEDRKELEDELIRLDEMDREPQIESDLEFPTVPRMMMPVDQEPSSSDLSTLRTQRDQQRVVLR